MSGENLSIDDLLESDQTDAQVQYEIGQCYLTGDGVEQNGSEAEKWLRRAADQGHNGAIALLAGSTEDKDSAQESLRGDNLPDWCLRAEEGDVEAQYQVACYFLEHGTEIDQEDAARYLTMAVRQEHPKACLLLARQQLDQGKLDGVVELLCKAADCGLWEAAELLGECYSSGVGVPKDPQEAERRFGQAAEWGGGEQMLRLALRYIKGDKVPVSRGRAFSWVQRAQDVGFTEAKEKFDQQYNLYIQEQQAEKERLLALQAQEEAERRHKAQEEAKRQYEAQKEAERQRQAKEEERRRCQAQKEAECQRQAEIQAMQTDRAKHVAFWIGTLMLIYVGICCLCQVFEVFHIPMFGFIDSFMYNIHAKNELIHNSLPGICCAGGYVLSRSGRQMERTYIVVGGLLVVQAVCVLMQLLDKGYGWFEFILSIIYLLIVHLIMGVIAFYVLLSLSVFVLNVLLGGGMTWSVYDSMNRAILRRLGMSK